MIEVSVVKNLPAKKTLVAEKKKASDQKPCRYYILNEKNVDQFIKRRKNLNDSDVCQHVATTSLAIVTGAYVGIKMNTNKFIKALCGLTTTAALYAGFNKMDDYLDNMGQNKLKKQFKVEEITGNEEKIAEALSYIPEENNDE